MHLVCWRAHVVLVVSSTTISWRHCDVFYLCAVVVTTERLSISDEEAARILGVLDVDR